MTNNCNKNFFTLLIILSLILVQGERAIPCTREMAVNKTTNSANPIGASSQPSVSQPTRSSSMESLESSMSTTESNAGGK